MLPGKFTERWYQSECSDALLNSILGDEECAPIVAIPTAGGKTVILSLFIKKYLELYPYNEVLVLSHTKKIVEQDIAALEEFFPGKHIAAYSAGLGRKEHGQITVGGIQSVINNPDLFRWCNLVIVDEVHKVSHNDEGNYRNLLKNMKARLTGLSATVFRTGHGYIHEGENRLFNKLAYDLTSYTNYTRLESEGYLAKLISVAPKLQLDSTKVKKSAGDYNVKDLARTHDKESITEAAIDEAMYYGKNYKKWLVFAIDIDHANHIHNSLIKRGINSDVLHSRVGRSQDSILKEFTEGETRALVSVEMITTGFDAPMVDLILMLRPTMSPVLHVQMAGRGIRPYPGKDHCLFLDYAGNTARLGPINDVRVPKKGKKKGDGEAPTKICPKCRGINFAVAKKCVICGHEFEFQTKLTTSASKESVVKRDGDNKTKWLNVTGIQYNIHQKEGKPPSLLITYHCGITIVKEWLGVEHPGFFGTKSRHKIRYRGYVGPMTTAAIFKDKAQLRVPKQILVDFSSPYPSIKNSKF